LYRNDGGRDPAVAVVRPGDHTFLRSIEAESRWPQRRLDDRPLGEARLEEQRERSLDRPVQLEALDAHRLADPLRRHSGVWTDVADRLQSDLWLASRLQLARDEFERLTVQPGGSVERRLDGARTLVEAVSGRKMMALVGPDHAVEKQVSLEPVQV